MLLDDLPTWRSMSSYEVADSEQLVSMAAAEFAAIPAYAGNPAYPAIPKISKTLISYLAGLTVTTPYYRGDCDERIKGLVEPHVTRCMDTLNTMNAAAYKTFVKEKLKIWFDLAPKAARSSVAGSVDGAVDGVGEAIPPCDEGEEGQIKGDVPSLD